MSNPAASQNPPPPLPGPADSAPASAPTQDWCDRYFRALAEHRQKARAALAAGQPLPVVVRRRRADPAFAQHEAEILECLADVLESEAIRRATARTPITKICSDALLNRLLKIFHPKADLLHKQCLAAMAPVHCSPQRPLRAKGDFNFDTALQRLEFKQWEREQAIAVALDLFYLPPEELHALDPHPRPAYRHLTPWNGNLVPREAPSVPSVNGTKISPPVHEVFSERTAFCEQTAGHDLECGDTAACRFVEPTLESPLCGVASRLAGTACGMENRTEDLSSWRSEREISQFRPNLSATLPSVSAVTPAESHSTPPAPTSASSPTSPHQPRRRLLWGLAMPPGSHPKTPSTVYAGYLPHLIRAGAISTPGSTSSSRSPRPDSS